MLEQPMRSTSGPQWPGALWIGQLDASAIPAAGSETLVGADGYHWARLLVRENRGVRGFVTLPVQDCRVDREDIHRAVAELPHAPAESDPPTPPVSVVICTRDRPELLADALEAVLRTEYPTFEVVVVDNASATDATRRLVSDHPDPRVRLVTEPRAGVSRGRNKGLRAAAYDTVAFVDDDVVVDPGWLTGMATGFARAADVALVCALVATGEVRTRPQAWFDQRVTWSDARLARQYRMSDPPKDVPLFPFQVGSYGTGASFAVTRSAYEQVGALDVAMGPGTPVAGGEDIDLFVRILASGYAVAVEPSALVWHRHRDDLAALETQAHGYGVGLGAWLTKTLLSPRLLRMALPLVPGAVARLRSIARGGSVDPDATDREFSLPVGYTRRLGHVELRSALEGPVRYAQSVLAALRP